MSNKILTVKDLRVSFNTYAGEVKAVRGVNFEFLPAKHCALWVNRAAANR